jgi:hypothetical protein
MGIRYKEVDKCELKKDEYCYSIDRWPGKTLHDADQYAFLIWQNNEIVDASMPIFLTKASAQSAVENIVNILLEQIKFNTIK